MVSPAAELPDPFVKLGLTFDDVLLLPDETDVIPSEVDTTTRRRSSSGARSARS